MVLVGLSGILLGSSSMGACRQFVFLVFVLFIHCPDVKLNLPWLYFAKI